MIRTGTLGGIIVFLAVLFVVVVTGEVVDVVMIRTGTPGGIIVFLAARFFLVVTGVVMI
jgi:hypothetical protein